MADIMNKYGKDLEATMNKHNNTKQRAADELHRKLAQRRKAREDALRDKHVKEVKYPCFYHSSTLSTLSKNFSR